MKQLVCALSAAIGLLLATATGAYALPPLDGGPLQPGQTEQVRNSSDQGAGQLDPTANVPVNVAIGNGGDVQQSNSGVSQTNGNVNATGQQVTQSQQGSSGDQPDGVWSNDRTSDGGDQQAESTSNRTDQGAGQLDPTVNVPVNAAVANGYGDGYDRSTPDCGCSSGSPGNDSGTVEQSNGAVTQTNGNVNLTQQTVQQQQQQQQPDGGGSSYGENSQNEGRAGQDESVSNRTSQGAGQLNPTLNVPINVAAFNKGDVDQRNGGVTQTNGNVNGMKQDVQQDQQQQSPPAEKTPCGCDSGDHGPGGGYQPEPGPEPCGCGTDKGSYQPPKDDQPCGCDTTKQPEPQPCSCDTNGGAYQPPKDDQPCGCRPTSTKSHRHAQHDSKQHGDKPESTPCGCETTGGKPAFGPSEQGQGGPSTQRESVSNRTDQVAGQLDPTANIPLNLAVGNKGDVEQRNGGVAQTNGNLNLTSQTVSQSQSAGKSNRKDCPPSPCEQPKPCHTHCEYQCDRSTGTTC